MAKVSSVQKNFKKESLINKYKEKRQKLKKMQKDKNKIQMGNPWKAWKASKVKKYEKASIAQDLPLRSARFVRSLMRNPTVPPCFQRAFPRG